MYNGIVNVYKEQGFTSFDVVAKMRGIFGQKKIGHTGTLDPMAEGVLLVCLGKAAKLSELLLTKEKEYDAVLRLGIRTDTDDVTGNVLDEAKVNVTEETVRNCFETFKGVQQ
jgi:Pseudouridine synthase